MPRMQRPAASTLALLFLLLSVATVQGQSPATVEAESVTEISQQQQLERDIQFLASDELQGRSVTDDTIDVARDYLRDRMQSIGLELDSENGEPFQSVEIPIGSQVKSVEQNFAKFMLDGEPASTAEIGKGFGPLAIGRNQAAASGPLLFVGYGISSDEHDFDDYASVDAKGAVVILMRKEPGASDPTSKFGGVKNTKHAFFATKVDNAIRHGAVAVLIVNDPASTQEAAQQESNRIRQESNRLARLSKLMETLPVEAKNNRAATSEKIERIKRLIETMKEDRRSAERGVLGISEAGGKSKQTDKIPVASIARDLVDQLLNDHAGESLEGLESQINRDVTPASRVLKGVTCEVSVDLKPAVAVSDNVIGKIAGKGPLASQTIVVGAHYDHVGMGGFASLAPGTIAVHNGADDNASGTATMLACGAALKRRLASVSSHRTVLLIGFTGEERGLVGSQYYVDHPTRPLEQTAAMINLDMVGRLRDNELTVYGTGTASGLNAMVDSVNQSFQFDLFKVASGFGPSDHQSFYRAGVPVLFFFTGLHNDYHRPSDDFAKIDFGDLTRVTDMVSEVAFRLSVRPQRPLYFQTDPRVQIRRQMTAFLGIRLTVRNGKVTITEVTAGGPASKAGLLMGDQIDRIGKQNIRTTSDVLSWVRNHSPGDEFAIEVNRNQTRTTLRGKLEKRSDK